MHTASPFWINYKEHGDNPEDVFIKPAVEGTLAVLKVRFWIYFCLPCTSSVSLLILPMPVHSKIQAASRAGINNVVLTSSTAAVTPQNPKVHPDPDQAGDPGSPPTHSRPFNEEDWNLDSTLEKGPYRLSKRRAEEAAWDYVRRLRARKEGDMRLAVMNPSFVLGEVVLARKVTYRRRNGVLVCICSSFAAFACVCLQLLARARMSLHGCG